MNEKIEQFKKEESDLFDENGKQYLGLWVSCRQTELMRDTIYELEKEIVEYKKQIIKYLEDIKIRNEIISKFKIINEKLRNSAPIVKGVESLYENIK